VIISPAIHFWNNPSFSNVPSLPLISNMAQSVFPGYKVGKPPSFHTTWGPVLSDSCAVSSEGGHLFTLVDVSVSLPVKVSKLAPFIGLESILWFFSSGAVGASLLLGSERWFHGLCGTRGRYWIRILSWDITHLLPCQQQLIAHQARGVYEL
jgi:hypothetical protein